MKVVGSDGWQEYYCLHFFEESLVADSEPKKEQVCKWFLSTNWKPAWDESIEKKKHAFCILGSLNGAPFGGVSNLMLKSYGNVEGVHQQKQQLNTGKPINLNLII